MKYRYFKFGLNSIFFFIASVLSFSFPSTVSAVERATEINVKVAGPVATASGYAAPFATVSAKIDDFRVGETIAGRQGSFELAGVGIYKGATELCFEVTDINDYGISHSCTSFKAASGDILIEGLFLPPTIGLVKNKIEEGESALVRGYSMPEITVEITQKGKVQGKSTVNTDKLGFYSKDYKDLKTGKYVFSAAASYKAENALLPLAQVELEVVEKGALTGTRIAEGENQIFLWVLVVLFIIVFATVIAVFILTQTAWGRRVMIKFKKTKFYAKAYKLYLVRIYPFLLKHKLVKPIQAQASQPVKSPSVAPVVNPKSASVTETPKRSTK